MARQGVAGLSGKGECVSLKAKEFIDKHKLLIDGEYTFLPHAVCRDGTEISVQIHGAAYADWDDEQTVEIAAPRNEMNHFTALESYDCGEFGQGSWKTRHVYGFVPLEVLEAMVARHGGIKTAV